MSPFSKDEIRIVACYTHPHLGHLTSNILSIFRNTRYCGSFSHPHSSSKQNLKRLFHYSTKTNVVWVETMMKKIANLQQSPYFWRFLCSHEEFELFLVISVLVVSNLSMTRMWYEKRRLLSANTRLTQTLLSNCIRDQNYCYVYSWMRCTIDN